MLAFVVPRVGETFLGCLMYRIGVIHAKDIKVGQTIKVADQLSGIKGNDHGLLKQRNAGKAFC